MRLILLIGVLTSVTALATVVVVALYLRKRASGGDIKLIGQLARVDTELDPEGTVIVCGELWRARSQDGVQIASRRRVRVVGFEGHLALVQVCD
jgi:membrane-bound ClpP family serine protease